MVYEDYIGICGVICSHDILEVGNLVCTSFVKFAAMVY